MVELLGLTGLGLRMRGFRKSPVSKHAQYWHPRSE